MIKIIWSDDFPSEKMATLIRDKFDISVSYFMEDYDFGIRIANWDYNSKILNFIKKKVDDVSVIEESKKSNIKDSKSLKESHHVWKNFSGANEKNTIQILEQIQNYFKNEYLNIEVIDFDYTNETIDDNAVTWWYECKGESLKYIDVDILKAYVQLAFRFEIDLDVFINKNKIYITVSEDEWN